MASPAGTTTKFQYPTRWSAVPLTLFAGLNGFVGLRPQGPVSLWLLTAWWVFVAIALLLAVRTWRSGVVFTDHELIFYNSFSTKRVPILKLDAISWSRFDSYPRGDWANVVAVRQGKVVANGPWCSWRYWAKVSQTPSEIARLQLLNDELARRQLKFQMPDS